MGKVQEFIAAYIGFIASYDEKIPREALQYLKKSVEELKNGNLKKALKDLCEGVWFMQYMMFGTHLLLRCYDFYESVENEEKPDPKLVKTMENWVERLLKYGIPSKEAKEVFKKSKKYRISSY